MRLFHPAWLSQKYRKKTDGGRLDWNAELALSFSAHNKNGKNFN